MLFFLICIQIYSRSIKYHDMKIILLGLWLVELFFRSA